MTQAVQQSFISTRRGKLPRTWVSSAYLITYGGFMLLGGRMADLPGRRRVLVGGTVVIAVSSLIGGLAESEGPA